MDWELYETYGNKNQDGYWIDDHKKWDYYAQRPDLYKKTKRKAFLFLLIPISGFILTEEVFKKMGLSYF